MQKLKGYFSLVRPPKIDFFEKCGKHGSGPVEKWSKMSAPKSGFQRRRWQTDPFFGLLGPFWGGGGQKIGKNFRKIFSKSRPNVHFWSKKFSKIFSKSGRKVVRTRVWRKSIFRKNEKFSPKLFSQAQKGPNNANLGSIGHLRRGNHFFRKKCKKCVF